MKAIEVLLNSKLPPDLRSDTRKLDKKGIDALMADTARLYPSRYAEISKIVSDLGRNAAYEQGETLTLNDMRPVVDKEKYLSLIHI